MLVSLLCPVFIDKLVLFTTGTMYITCSVIGMQLWCSFKLCSSLHLGSRDCEFDSRPHGRKTTLDKSFTLVCLSLSSDAAML